MFGSVGTGTKGLAFFIAVTSATRVESTSLSNMCGTDVSWSEVPDASGNPYHVFPHPSCMRGMRGIEDPLTAFRR